MEWVKPRKANHICGSWPNACLSVRSRQWQEFYHVFRDRQLHSCESDKEFMYPGDMGKNKGKQEEGGRKLSGKISSSYSGSILLVHFFWTGFRKKNNRHIFPVLLCLEVVYLSRIDRVGDMSENLMTILIKGNFKANQK